MKKLVHGPETAVYARLIADEALSGKALVHIARLLNEHGVESARGGEWNSSSVMQLLRSPAFAGLMPQTEYEEGEPTPVRRRSTGGKRAASTT
ncbi:recombinase family protein [Streptomyces globosus]|uniref:recombinase family protein n=1 Tax=Streptomyces globosus TaxID=68209 RepID=UPI0013B3BB13|nr:recombinase family protein [Streptomyces globosus]